MGERPHQLRRDIPPTVLPVPAELVVNLESSDSRPTLALQRSINRDPDHILSRPTYSRDMYLYLRTKNILLPHTRKTSAGTKDPPLLLNRVLTIKFGKPLSMCYNALLEAQSCEERSNMKQWEGELGHQLTMAQWYEALSNTKSASKSLSLWEAYCKIAMRWYLVPHRLAKICKGASKLCWRCEGGAGTMLHMFWDCHSLGAFWTQIQNLISSTTGLLVQLRPEHYLLHMIPGISPHPHKKVLINILMVAKILLAQNWKSKTIPTMATITERLDVISSYERMASRVQGQEKKNMIENRQVGTLGHELLPLVEYPTQTLSITK
ncbi:Hypothetical predicted protein [Pelobates cultripes]|uniref:Uncharacterized protein n=1 Tax=Pelobates cultripes TaxID=61616 RepID=A0AAD1SZ20_PELCU|nr:Hypothetical predicted protein [Pelobates cultripes]